MTTSTTTLAVDPTAILGSVKSRFCLLFMVGSGQLRGGVVCFGRCHGGAHVFWVN
ncbi:hypothetical protein BVRB_5g114570 isoform B [Beta vulgaris subsp. vulgaris]|nr:hypothetical protein BVRB_5g114570 isoform B [Beta vulgaris subsp. vulgaris]